MRHAIDFLKFASSTKISSGSKQELDFDDQVADKSSDHFGQAPSHFGENDGEFSMRQILEQAEYFCGDDILFDAIAATADKANVGDLVVYRIGDDDPSELVANAMARGAAGILTEQLLPCPLPQCIVGDVELAMAEVAAHTLEHPDRAMLTIGVVGSSGKTTTSLLISSLLRDAGTRTAYQTDLGECDGIVQSTPSTGVPSGESLIHWLSEANDGQCQAAVIELSADDARHGLYDSIEFDILVVTGSASLSSDFGQSPLQCLLDQLKPTGVVVASNDDPKAIRVIRDSGSRLTTYGLRSQADLSAKIIDQSDGMSTLMITQDDTSVMMETALCGSAMAQNHLAAAVVGVLINQPLTQITETLSRLRSVPARGQRLSDFENADVILDAGGSPERVESSMRMARSMKGGGQLWCVLAINDNDCPEYLTQYGTHVERFSNKTVVTCQRSMKESYLKSSHYLLDGVERCAAMRLVADHQRAIQWAVSEAKPQDTILVIGGVSTHCAHQQRTDIQQLTSWIEAARKEKDAPVALPDSVKNTKATILPMFQKPQD